MSAATDTARFKEAMARFPSGVTIVTTTDQDGCWKGFTASSFCSVSLEPPLVLVCLANGAECYPTFASADRWNIHIIGADHAELAIRFATRGADKFTNAGFTTDEYGLPRLTEACITLHCEQHDLHDGGDHAILVGHVTDARLNQTDPALYYQRTFHRLGQQT